MDHVPANSVRDWLQAECIMDEVGRIRTIDAYRSYCQFTGMPAWPDTRGISMKRFVRAVIDQGGGGVRVVKVGVKYFDGMRIKPNRPDPGGPKSGSPETVQNNSDSVTI